MLFRLYDSALRSASVVLELARNNVPVVCPCQCFEVACERVLGKEMAAFIALTSQIISATIRIHRFTNVTTLLDRLRLEMPSLNAKLALSVVSLLNTHHLICGRSLLVHLMRSSLSEGDREGNRYPVQTVSCFLGRTLAKSFQGRVGLVVHLNHFIWV